MRRLALAASAFIMLLSIAGVAQAQQAYPNKTVRLVVPYAAGGSVDPMARLMADRLSKATGQSFIVENRPGAGGNIGIEAVVRGPKDGYTLLATPAAVAINPSLYSKVPYNIERDLVPFSLVNRTTMFVLVNPGSGINSIADLVARAKEKPRAMNYGTAGNGTLDHLVCEHLIASAGVEIVKVNYQGVPKGVAALLANEVQMMVVSSTAALPFMRSGQLKAIAATSGQRSPYAPDVPTMTELGFKDFEMYGFTMLFAPNGVPADIVKSLHETAAKVVGSPDLTKVITDMGGDPQALSLEQLRAFLKGAEEQFARIVKSSGAKAD